MKREKVKYTDDKGEMAGELVRIKDFLPSPDQPVESVTVTLHGERAHVLSTRSEPATDQLRTNHT